QETLRMYPPAWTIARESLTDCELGGYPVPRGSQLWLVQWGVHYDERWDDAPSAFPPERWGGDLIQRMPPGAFFPFGDGPRICIGQQFALMEATLLLATIAQRYRMRPVPRYKLELVPSVTLRPLGGLPLILEARRKGRPR